MMTTAQERELAHIDQLMTGACHRIDITTARLDALARLLGDRDGVVGEPLHDDASAVINLKQATKIAKE